MLEFIKSLDMLHQVLVCLWLGFGISLCIPNYFTYWMCQIGFINAKYDQSATGIIIDSVWLSLTLYLGITLF